MGTRHLIAVQIDGIYKVAQYGQWDGHPSGQGADVLAFLRSVDLPKFADAVRSVSFLTDEDVEQINNIIAEDGLQRSWQSRWPALSRDAGAKILGMVMESRAEPLKLKNSIDFANDSLFCEWAYVIDLDAMRLEVFRGFNRVPPEDGARFKGETDGEYYPVMQVASWALSDLPTDAEMVTACERSEEANGNH